MNNAIEHYKRIQIQTVDEKKLVVMLYDGALKFLREAKKAIGNKDIENAHNNIIKVQRIISELLVSLNMEKGGEIAKNLQAIYLFINKQLMIANIKKDLKILNDLEEILSTLREGFHQILKKPSQSPTEDQKINKAPSLNLKG